MVRIKITCCLKDECDRVIAFQYIRRTAVVAKKCNKNETVIINLPGLGIAILMIMTGKKMIIKSWCSGI